MMSRFLRKPIRLPDQVEVSCSGRRVAVSGSRGRLDAQLPPGFTVDIDGRELWLRRGTTVAGGRPGGALAGTTYATLRNLVEGVSRGFEQRLEVVGVGYRAQVDGRTLNLALGFSHPVAIEIPADMEVETPQPTEIVVRGMDRQAVGSLAARIRLLRKPEPYKGKGVKRAGEVIRRKETKRKT